MQLCNATVDARQMQDSTVVLLVLMAMVLALAYGTMHLVPFLSWPRVGISQCQVGGVSRTLKPQADSVRRRMLRR